MVIVYNNILELDDKEISMSGFSKIILMSTLFLMLGAGCNSSPTVPVPPPQATSIEASVPDQDGFVTVSGMPDPRYGLEDVALVFNDNTGDGVMTDVQLDGSFLTRILANYDDILIIQIKRDNHISEPVEKSIGQ